MSGACAASSTDWLRRFDSVWHVDFEFRQDADHRPVPVCMHAFEQHTGTEIPLWRDQLLTLRRAPFGTGPPSDWKIAKRTMVRKRDPEALSCRYVCAPKLTVLWYS